MVKMGKVGLIAAIVIGASSTPVFAQNIQNQLNHEAQTVQQEMNHGMITPGQAAQMDGQVYQTAQQYQMDKAMNGGHLNPMQAQQLRYQAGAVGQGIRGTTMQNQWNAGALNNWSSGNFQHHHHPGPGAMANNPAAYNQGQYNQGYNQYNQGYGQSYGQGYNGQMYPGQYPNQNFNQGGMSQASSLLRRFFH